jgi:hypothetical protein
MRAVDARLDPLRSHPRFRALIERMRFPRRQSFL